MAENIKSIEHKLEVNARRNLKITGVNEVVSATTSEIIAKTECGPLSITGQNLKVKSLLINEKILEAEGDIAKIEYAKAKKNFFQKIIK